MDDRQHEHLIESLPDYVLGALDAPEAEAVARHLRSCPVCPPYVESLQEVLALLGPSATPRAEVRASLLARAGSRPSAGQAAGLARTPRQEMPTSAQAAPEPIPLRSRRPPPWQIALVAVLAGLLLVSGVLNVLQGRRLAQQEEIARLLANPQAAHALADTDLDSGAAGVLYSEPGSAVALLVANRLTPPPAGQQYQVWLFTEDGRRESGGQFAVDADGNGQALLRAPQPFANYWAVGVSAEPLGGSPAPTSALAVGGWLR